MIRADRVEELKYEPRRIELSRLDDPDLDVLQLLPGTWSNAPDLIGRGWNAIALPFASGSTIIDYRLLVNQYNEVLQYMQIVLLDFFARLDGMPGLIRWPHVSINTMAKMAEADAFKTIIPAGEVKKSL